LLEGQDIEHTYTIYGGIGMIVQGSESAGRSLSPRYFEVSSLTIESSGRIGVLENRLASGGAGGFLAKSERLSDPGVGEAPGASWER
jgi:hypothetical protein